MGPVVGLETRLSMGPRSVQETGLEMRQRTSIPMASFRQRAGAQGL